MPSFALTSIVVACKFVILAYEQPGSITKGKCFLQVTKHVIRHHHVTQLSNKCAVILRS
jgi:hypothetical protein